ncbi:MAG TPA: NAD(P)-binding domain-containing protein [Kofleriaceae bacterium]|nr:NAD(P)-binding domain-containing protein [Kofleriaceae bacterium]
MRIGILGTGDVGKALASAFIALGHDVKMGAREAGNAKAAAWAAQAGARASAGTFADAAEFADIAVLATLGAANEDVLAAAGADRLRGKVLIDATNPLDMTGGPPPKLSVGHTDSGGEQVQRQVPGALVVKAFNTVGNAHMFRPSFPGGRPDMFIAGNDAGAKKKVAALLDDFGWGVVDVGGIESSRYLEAMCIVWVLHGIATGTWNHAFKLLTM